MPDGDHATPAKVAGSGTSASLVAPFGPGRKIINRSVECARSGVPSGDAMPLNPDVSSAISDPSGEVGERGGVGDRDRPRLAVERAERRQDGALGGDRRQPDVRRRQVVVGIARAGCGSANGTERIAASDLSGSIGEIPVGGGTV